MKTRKLYFIRTPNQADFKPCDFCGKKSSAEFSCDNYRLRLCDRCLHTCGLKILEGVNNKR